MLYTRFNVPFVIYSTLGKLIVASKTILMKIDDQCSTLLAIISIQRLHNTFLAITIPTHMLLILIEKLKNERGSFRKALVAHIIQNGGEL